MSRIAIYDPGAVVANQVIQYLTRAHTPDYTSEPNKVVNPDLSAVEGQPMKWWKVSAGEVVLMSSGEQTTVDNSLLPAAKTAKKASLQDQGALLVDNQGYSVDIKSNLQMLYANSIRILPNRAAYLQPWVDWLAQVDTEVKTKQASVDVQTILAGVDAVVLDTATLIAADPHKTLSGALAVTDSSDLAPFLDANAEVTDPVTGIKGPFYIMQELEMRKDLYNDTENPIYDSTHVPILGESGILVDHANRVLNLELIHGKTGWHEQEIKKSTYKRPIDLLIYYGYPNSFNSGVNGWDNEKVAQDMAKYGIIILGDGVEDPSHPDYANTQVIIPRVKQYNPSALIFGYVAAAQSLANFQTKTDQWNTLQVHGIFIDEAGYDYGKTRAEFNTMVDYVHGKTYSKLVFANAWNTDHILGTVNDVSFPNSTYNSGLVESSLTYNDWILLESFPVNTTAFSGDAGYESRTDWFIRGAKALSLRSTYSVNFAACGVINNDNASGQALFNFLFISSLTWSLEASGSSDTNYASGSATVTYWTRPDIKDIGVVWNLSASVQQDTGDADVYYRYAETARLLLDFSTAAQTSSITKW